MTTIPAGSPHYRAAVENRYAGDARFTEATLAVAYEMRTANLIALAELRLEQGDYDSIPPLIREVKSRLDLT